MDELEKNLNCLSLNDGMYSVGEVNNNISANQTVSRKKQRIEKNRTEPSDIIELLHSVKRKKVVTSDEINDLSDKFVDMKFNLQQQIENTIECTKSKNKELDKLKDLDKKFTAAIIEMMLNYHKRDVYNLYVDTPPPYTECH